MVIRVVYGGNVTQNMVHVAHNAFKKKHLNISNSLDQWLAQVDKSSTNNDNIIDQRQCNRHRFL